MFLVHKKKDKKEKKGQERKKKDKNNKKKKRIFLPLCTFKTPTKWAVINEQGVSALGIINSQRCINFRWIVSAMSPKNSLEMPPRKFLLDNFINAPSP